MILSKGAHFKTSRAQNCVSRTISQIAPPRHLRMCIPDPDPRKKGNQARVGDVGNARLIDRAAIAKRSCARRADTHTGQ
jgi:hypothetical protein